MMEFRTVGGQGILRLQNTTGPVRKLEYWNGSAWVAIVTIPSAIQSTLVAGKRFDMRCKIHGSTGVFALYVDYVLVGELTGNTDFFSAAIESYHMVSWGQFNARIGSEFIVSTSDTRKYRVYETLPTGDSATNTGGTGGFANVDDNPTSNYTTADADGWVSSASGQVRTYTHPALPLNMRDGIIRAVAVEARASNDGSSADFDLVLRSGGANYAKAHTRTINSTKNNGFYAIWDTDPNGDIPWTVSAVDAAEFGMQSKNTGASTVTMVRMVVVVEKQTVDVWDDTYPASGGITVVDYTTPSTTGLHDLTCPEVVAAGCTPKAVLFFGTNTTGLGAGSRFFIGALCNRPDNEWLSKGGIQLRADDNSGSTTNASTIQQRNLQAFTTANSGWPIDTPTIRAQFCEWINGGVRLNWATATATRVTVVFIWGSDLDFNFGSASLGTGTSALPITGLGFAPQALFAITARADVTNWRSAFGVAVDSGGIQQKCLMRTSAGNIAAGPQPTQQIDTSHVGGLLTTAGALEFSLTLNSFDADGFTVTPSASSSSSTLLWFAFRHATKAFSIIDITTPTVPGVIQHTGAGFLPGFGMGVLSSLQTTGSIETDVEQSSSMALSVFGPDLTATVSAMAEVTTSDPSDVNSYQDASNLIRIGTNSGTVAEVVGAYDGPNNDGISVDYTTVSTTGKKGFFLLMEGDAPPPPPSGNTATGLIFVAM